MVAPEEVRMQHRSLRAPLSDVFKRCGQALGLNQSELARLLGISAPMLSSSSTPAASRSRTPSPRPA